MKKKLYSKIIIAAFATTYLVSCSDNAPSVDTSEFSELQFTAVSVDSRTSLTSNNGVVWNMSDKIAIFGSGDSNAYEFNNTLEQDAQAEATFTGIGPNNATAYYALYPYSAESTLNGTTITTKLSNFQNATRGTFTNGQNISVATADASKKLQFKNICGLIKFELVDVDGATAITIVSKDESQMISGNINIDMSNNTITNLTNGSNSISLVCQDGFEKNTAYYMTVPPVVFNNGFKIQLQDGRYVDGKAGYQIEAGKINPITISTSDLTQGIVETKDVTISSIEEISPEGGNDRLLLTLSESVLVGTFFSTDLNAFDIKVTNNGDSKLNVTGVQQGENANEVILVLDSNTPVYFDDELSIEYKAEESKITVLDGGKVNLKTDANTTFQGYVNLIYAEDFESSTDPSYYLSWVPSTNWKVNQEEGSNVLAVEGNAGAGGMRLKTMPTITPQPYSYYTFELKGYSTVVSKINVRFCPSGIYDDKASIYNTSTEVQTYRKDIILNNYQYNGLDYKDKDIVLYIYTNQGSSDDVYSWIDNVKIYERECRNYYSK